MKLAELPEVQNLPVREKLELVDELWLALTQELESLEVSDDEKTLLDERWEAFLKDPDSALSLDQFRQKFGERRA
jgi:putative addiction module component (TIGR02574 family)